jgi:hypothetical protein
MAGIDISSDAPVTALAGPDCVLDPGRLNRQIEQLASPRKVLAINSK